MPWHMITSDGTDKFRVGLHIYIYWASEIEGVRYSMGSYKDGDSVFLYDGRKIINTATVNRVFRIDELRQRKREAGVTSYIELTFNDKNKWFCTEPQPSDPFGGVFLCKVIYDEWVLRAKI